MNEYKFVSGEKVKISNLETIDLLFEKDGRTKLVDKWAGHILTFSYLDSKVCVYTEEADTTFHINIVEKLPFKAPEHLFQIE